ncbi:alpha/beta fold hydrolase [Winogradskya humida]|uniref:Hydrolase n=1 Tax=Winogradskya humida TaxID=113566 RepID=A0ABQ3ZZZ8_9ACTN|nr:alpha/beta fold hydrolase [Actinoplanes humidus]GIE24039.1 hydrolase [Actinoplanes humidus]
MPLLSRLVAAGLAVSALLSPAPVQAAAHSSSSAARSAVTGETEARRVGRVATPKLHWYACYGWAQCATAKVPLDYDHPYGAQTTIALLRVRATDQKHRIGSLFVNPGGPGASATNLALAAPSVFSQSILERFDIVGMDPRGIGSSDPVNCFPDTGTQTKALKGMNVAFPVGAAETKAYLTSVRTLAHGCSTTGRPLAGSMSTAEVARDMEVMRRAVGDSKLNYFGFSYGTALGQYYANMFPDRFRVIAVDGVINPRNWVGTARTQNTVQDVRLGSAVGAEKALHRILTLCDQAGTAKCEFAAGNPVARFATITAALKAKPLTIQGEKLTYAAFIGAVLSSLYGQDAPVQVTGLAADVWTLMHGGAASTGLRRAFAYDNSLDAYASVMCTDGRHPAHLANWPAKVAKASARARYFGAAWAWASAPCARDAWTVRDEDAYTGPFTRTTKNTVLVVGSYWDPATNYYEAVGSANQLGNARLLSSNNFGHTAYTSSPCVTKGIDNYLLHKTLPAKGTVCTATQPFTTTLDTGTDSAATPKLNLLTATKADIVAAGLPAPDAPKQGLY